MAFLETPASWEPCLALLNSGSMQARWFVANVMYKKVGAGAGRKYVHQLRS